MRKFVTAVPAVLATLAVVVALWWGLGDGSPHPSVVRMAGADSQPTVDFVGSWAEPIPEPVHPDSYPVADAVGDEVELFERPGVPFEERPVLDNPTHEGLPLLFRVLAEEGPWLQVQPSMRPNEMIAWIKRDQVEIRRVPNRIEIDLADQMVRVFHADDMIWEAESVIGSDRTPTPLGTFFVDGWVPLQPGGVYGAGQLSVAGFSNVLHSFGGGNGQIAIHGTNRPEQVGTAISNGCVRVPDEKLFELVELAPLGTPVVVSDSATG